MSLQKRQELQQKILEFPKYTGAAMVGVNVLGFVGENSKTRTISSLQLSFFVGCKNGIFP